MRIAWKYIDKKESGASVAIKGLKGICELRP